MPASRSRLSAVGAVALVSVLGALLCAGPAAALPPDGAGPDTPGTSASVSPRTLAPCETLSFTVTGYPPGETLYVKIDDGVGYGDASVQGSGVWHWQAIPASGTVNGSFQLPCGITPGSHWLRLLASEYVDPSDPNRGVLGYTRRGGTEFTVVATIGGPNGGTVTGPRTTAPAPGTTVGSGAEQTTGQGGIIAVDPELVATPEPSPSPEPSHSPEPSPSPGATPSSTAVGDETDSGIPLVGIIGGGAIVLLGGLGAAWVLLRRGGNAAHASRSAE